MVLKADGAATTWQYDNAIWTDTTVLSASSTDLSLTEAKFRSFDTVAFNEILLMTNIGGVFRTQRLTVTSTSLRALITAGSSDTSIGRAAWSALFGGADIQPNCDAEGFDAGLAAPYSRVRIGLIGNNEGDCSSPDSFMGIGGIVGPGNGCVGSTTSVGALSGCGLDTDAPAFAYVFVRQRPPPGAYPIPFAPQATTGTSLSLSDDSTSGLLPLGFSFRFFATTYTQVNISSNGFIGFDAGMSSGCCSGRPLPAADGINNIIAASWTDLYPPGGGSITYETRGVAPSRRLVVSYGTVPWCCSGPPQVTTQIILFEGTDLVEIHTTSQNAGHTYSQGVEDPSGTLAYSLPGRSAASYALTNDGAQFVTY